MIRIKSGTRYLIIEGETLNGTNYLYRDEKNSVRLINTGQPAFIGEPFTITINNVTVSYETDDTGGCICNIDYLLDQVADMVDFTITFSNAQTGNDLWTTSAHFTIHKGVNPKNVIRPKCNDLYTRTGDSSVLDYILPPNVMYTVNPEDVNGTMIFPTILFESNMQGWSLQNGTALSPIWNSDTYQVNTNPSYVRVDVNKVNYPYYFEKLGNCTEYVIVRWKSRFGSYRQNVFRVREITDGTNSSNTLSIAGNGLRSMKETYNKCTIEVDGLTRYGLWYYEDLLLSSDVHATRFPRHAVTTPSDLNGLYPMLELEETSATVEGKSYSLSANDSRFYTFTATLYLKDYPI